MRLGCLLRNCKTQMIVLSLRVIGMSIELQEEWRGVGSCRRFSEAQLKIRALLCLIHYMYRRRSTWRFAFDPKPSHSIQPTALPPPHRGLNPHASPSLGVLIVISGDRDLGNCLLVDFPSTFGSNFGCFAAFCTLTTNCSWDALMSTCSQTRGQFERAKGE